VTTVPAVNITYEKMAEFEPLETTKLPELTWQTVVCQDGKVVRLSELKEII